MNHISLLLSLVLSADLVFGTTVYIYMDADPFATTNNTILNFIPTFETYLSGAVRDLFPGSNLTFKLFHYDGTIYLDDLVSENRIDFYYGGPNTVACLESTYFASPIVTARKKKPGGGVIDGYGGAIVVSSSNKKINTVQDLKGAIIGVQQQNGWASNILQQGILSRSGIYIFRDAKQVTAAYFSRSLSC